MGTLPRPGDVLYDAGDLVALTSALVGALEGGQRGAEAGLAERLGLKAGTLRLRLIAECGFSHMSTLVRDEQSKLEEPA